MKFLKPVASGARTKHAFAGLDHKGLTMHLESLAPALGTGFLNLHWILQAMEAMLASHSDVQQLLSLGGAYVLKKDRNWESVFLDDNAKLLEVCNIIKQGMSRAGRSRMHVKYVLQLLDVSRGGCYDEARLVKVRKALQDCFADLGNGMMDCREQDQHKHKGSRLLEEVSHGLLYAKNMGAVRKTKIASKVYEANLISVFVLSALLAALTCKASSSVALQVSKELPWASALLRLQEGIKEESEARNQSGGGLLEGVYSCLRQISSLVDSLLDRGMFVLSKDEEDRMDRLLQQLRKKLEYFESGLEMMEELMADLFQKLVANRNLLLS